MSGSSSLLPDDSRISTTAALTALGGHALIILGALLLGARTSTVVTPPGMVGVTLVSGAPGGGGAASSAPPPAPASTSALASTTAPPSTLAGEGLDRLFAPPPAARAAAPASSTPPMMDAQAADDGVFGASGAAAIRPGESGYSQVGQGLGPGEGADGIDLYAAASLPNVGPRPTSPPIGDLWKKVSPCWRSASQRKATLMVEIGEDGRLAGLPRAIRKISAPIDPQLLLAERAAARALQACAPYEGLSGRTWRVAFP